MTIGVDLDSVLAYIEEPLLDFLNQEYKTNHGVEDVKNYDLSILWKCSPEEMIDRIYKFFRSPFMGKVVPVEGSMEGISQLGLKNNLVVITSRPLWLEEKTDAWLSKYFPDMFEQVVHTNQLSKEGEEKVNKSDICSILGATILIEDCSDYCEDCAENGIKVYLYDRPWNSSFEPRNNVTRVFGWEDINKRLSSKP